MHRTSLLLLLLTAFTLGALTARLTGDFSGARADVGVAQNDIVERVVVSGAVGAYRGQVLRVLDGDTIEARITIWPGHDVTTLVRLRGIDAPELDGACRSEITQATRARDMLAALLAGGTAVISEVTRDKYGGRVVAHIAGDNGTDVGMQLMTQGLASAYTRGRRRNWCGAAG